MKPCTYNLETKNQLWCSIIADGHDCICGCDLPFAHLLASIFPPGHQDRQLTIEQILERDYKQLCHSGGHGDASHGMVAGGDHTGGAAGLKREEEEYIKDEELENLIAAGEDAGTR